ncbi:hypothetical protein D3C85_1470920 [compost metagenome]
MGIECAQAAISDSDNGRTEHPQYQAAPMPGADALTQDKKANQQGEQRRRLRQQAGGPGAYSALAKVERHMMPKHGKKPEQYQERQVLGARQADAAPHRNKRHE